MQVNYEKMEECKEAMIGLLNGMDNEVDKIRTNAEKAGNNECWAGNYYNSFLEENSELIKETKKHIECLRKFLQNISLAASNYKQVDQVIKNQLGNSSGTP